MSKYEDEYGDPSVQERAERLRDREEDPSYRSSQRRERSRERTTPSARREDTRQSSSKGKQPESSPLKFVENYMDDPSKHDRRQEGPEDGWQRHETAVRQVESGFRQDDATGDNRRAHRDLDRDGKVARRDFAR